MFQRSINSQKAADGERASDGDAEGLPTVVIEAMAAGTPVIGSRHAGIGEAVEDECTGFLIPEQDPEALAAALRRLSDEPGFIPQAPRGGNAPTAAAQAIIAVPPKRTFHGQVPPAVFGGEAGNRDRNEENAC
jgi:glycosyl transferase family 1